MRFSRVSKRNRSEVSIPSLIGVRFFTRRLISAESILSIRVTEFFYLVLLGSCDFNRISRHWAFELNVFKDCTVFFFSVVPSFTGFGFISN